MTQDTTDMTPEELRVPLLNAAKAHIPFEGWHSSTLESAAEDIGVSAAMAELAYPGGTADLLDAWLKSNDVKLQERLDALDLQSMKIRDRITKALQIKLELNAQDREIISRTVPSALMPDHAAVAAKALWRTCDLIWRAAGDTAMDFNHYPKRATLAAVYSSLLIYWLNDNSDGYADSHAFLDRRIENVMQFEKAKAHFRKVRANLPSVSRFLSKLRYPDRA